VAALTLPDLVEEERFWPVLTKTLECLTAEIDKAKGPPRCYTGFMVGDAAGPLGVAADCKSGVAWVRPVQGFPSAEFPQPTDAYHCGIPDAMTIEIGIARYAPRAEGRNMQPDPQEMFNATRLYMSDFAVMRRTICCVQAEYKNVLDVSRGAWDPIPVGAGLAGGTWTFTVG
jgi:hypothetical protein